MKQGILAFLLTLCIMASLTFFWVVAARGQEVSYSGHYGHYTCADVVDFYRRSSWAKIMVAKRKLTKQQVIEAKQCLRMAGLIR